MSKMSDYHRHVGCDFRQRAVGQSNFFSLVFPQSGHVEGCIRMLTNHETHYQSI